MKQPNIPDIPQAQPEPQSKLWLGALILSIISVVFSALASWHGFVLAFIGLACAVVAFVLIWKDFQFTKKLISILVLSICAVVLSAYTFGASAYTSARSAMYYYDTFGSSWNHETDEWHGIGPDEFDDYWD